MKTSARIAVVGIWLVLMAAAGGAGAGVEPKSVPDDAYWSDQFHVPGTDGEVHAAVKDASGNIYIGGDFTVVGDIIAKGVAKWNVSTSTWSALGTGVEGGEYGPGVEALAVDGSGNLYAGGDFTTAGGNPANCIAKWDGTAWSPLGAGLDGVVLTLAVDGSGNVYAGGVFTTAGGVTVNHIAKWDGTAWSALGTGVGGAGGEDGPNVSALAVDGSGNVYAGGVFTTAGSVAANYIAKWDGTAWSALGTGMAGDEYGCIVYALVVDSSGNLYAGGDFGRAGGVLGAASIAKWDGTAWSHVGGGTNGSVHSLTADNSGNVYAGGWFSSVGGHIVHSIAKWDGSAWSAFGTGVVRSEYLEAHVYAVAVDGSGDVYAGGDFTMAGGVPACGIAKWDGAAWLALGTGMNAPVNALAVDGSGKVYVGGEFTSVGEVDANHVAKWDGTAWSPVGTGVEGIVWALAVDGSGNLYAGTEFTWWEKNVEGTVAKWDGTAWSTLGTRMDRVVYALAVDGSGDVYAGGGFTTAGDVDANYIAKWDGTAWSALGTGMGGTDWPYVSALAADGAGNVYAGGKFTTAGGVLVNGIAKWNGTVWSALGTGVEAGLVFSLVVDGSGNLYAGGWFQTVGGILVNGIAKWNGTAWSALGTGIEGGEWGVVWNLTVDDWGDVYAGGWFTTAGGVSANNIAKWDGAAWSPLGSGIGGPGPGLSTRGQPGVFALALDGSGNLYSGGNLTTAGGKVSGFFAVWNAASVAPPDAPTVTGVTPTDDTTPTWTWTSGGGGNGTYRYQLDGTGGTWTETTNSSYTPATPLSEGTHTLYVQESNSVGDWSAAGSFAITVIEGQGEGEDEPEDDGPPPGCFGG